MKALTTPLVLFSCIAANFAESAFSPKNRPLDVKNYRIALRLDPETNPDRFEAEVEIQFKPTQSLSEVEWDQEDLTLHEARLETAAAALVTESHPDRFVLKFPQELPAEKMATVTMRYAGKIGTAHEGFFKVSDPDEKLRGPLFFTHFEPLAARKFFPGNDEPYDKATTEMIVTVPADYEALSNGKVVSTKAFQEGTRRWKTVHWRLDKPHSTYLVSLAVGRFSKVARRHHGREISIWVGATKVDKARYALNAIAKSMDFFESFVGVKYPWSKYATVTIPTFVWGGMENTTSTHQNQERTLLNDPMSESEKGGITALSSHELAHQWFGNFATLKWWDDLWLNETFATYLDVQAFNHAFQSDEGDIGQVLATWDGYFRQENGPRSHPIVDKQLDSARDAFDTISYTKGQNVLRMLEFYVGKSNLQAGMKRYLERFAFSNATYRDFFQCVAEASGENLDRFRDTWLLQRGYPILSYSGAWNAADKTYRFELKQRSNHESDTSVFAFRIPVVFHRQAKPAFTRIAVLNVATAQTTRAEKLPAEPEWVSVNPGSVVLGKVMQAVRDEGLLAQQARRDPDSLARIRAAYDLLEPMLEGTGSPSALAETTAVEVLQADPSPFVRMAILSAADRMKTRWLPKGLSASVLKLAENPESGKGFSPRARRLWRASLLRALGKVPGEASLGIVVKALGWPDLPLDDLGAAAASAAAHGTDKSISALRRAVMVHSPRGYRYRYASEIAFGAYESPKAAQEVSAILARCGSDLAGRIGRVVRDNQTLKNSPEWAEFLSEFILKDTRHGDEVKARLLQTIEEVKTSPVQGLLKTISDRSTSPRLQGLARKILEKNYSDRT